MPQPPHKLWLNVLRKEAVAYAAAYERSHAANVKDGSEATIRDAMRKLMPDRQSQDLYLGAFWGMKYAFETFTRCMARAQKLIVPGQKQPNVTNQYGYSLRNMMGVAAVRAGETKRKKGIA